MMKLSKKNLQREREVLGAITEMLKEVKEVPFKKALEKLENIEHNIIIRIIDIEKKLGIRK